MQEIDTNNGVMFPFYDQDTNMVYLCGKVSNYISALCVSLSVCLCLFWGFFVSVVHGAVLLCSNN